MKKKIILIIIPIIIIIGTVSFYFVGISPVSKSDKEVKFVVKGGISKFEIVDNLKTANLIKSKYATLAYLFFNSDIVLQAGNYYLSENMGSEAILKKIANGDTIEKYATVELKLIEGKKIEKYITSISEGFNYTTDEIKEKLSDEKYLKQLINDYWFLTDDILKDGIKYPLEGYLFPDTYKIPLSYSIDQIIRVILDNTEKKLEPYKDLISSSKYNIHELMTIASIIEMEGTNGENRPKISQVIYTRLDKRMALGMDVTTYYAVDKEMTESLTVSDLNSVSPYNTRNASTMSGKLPIGPITNPSLESIDAAFNPSETNYLYFFANIETGEIYFASTYEEFLQYKNS